MPLPKIANHFMVTYSTKDYFKTIEIFKPIAVWITSINVKLLFVTNFFTINYLIQRRICPSGSWCSHGITLNPCSCKSFHGTPWEDIIGWNNKNYNQSEVLVYRSYVDVTFCLFHSEQDANLFFDFINSQHPNIHFTMEKEINHLLPFLDALLDNKASPFPITSTYRKKLPSRVYSPISWVLHLFVTR